MWFLSSIRKKTFVLGGFILLALIALPFTLFFFQQKQVTTSEAEKTVVLSYEPDTSQTSPQLQIPAGSTFSLDVYVDPGTNSVSYVKLAMLYDPTKFQPAGGFIPNLNVFSQVIEGPINQSGKITETLSIGTDLSKVLKVRTKVGTLTLKALETAPANSVSSISFGDDSQALSVSGNSSYDENVIANTTPVSVRINQMKTSCGTTPSDVMLTMDTSDSMLDKLDSGTKLSYAKSAADTFINLIAKESSIRIGLVTFDINSVLRSGLTDDYATVKSIIDNDTHTGDQTCMQCGILTANQEISAHKRPGVKNIVILLTDGEALNYIGQKSGTYNKTLGEKYALEAAEDGYKANGTVFYTIGLGNANDFDPAFLKTLANTTGGGYYYSPTSDQLNDIYNQISQTLRGGSVTGTVFNDANGNGVFDPNEQGIPGVLLQLYPLSSSTPTAVISTSSDGTYNLEHLCDGTYTIKQEVPSTWKQTLPSDIRGYTFTMTNGKAITNQNFGDMKLPPTPVPSVEPTVTSQPSVTVTPALTIVPSLNISPSASATPTPTGTQLLVNILLHGIGNSGDNANPTASSLSNKSPLHPSRTATAYLYDVNNTLVSTASGVINYSNASGSFTGTLYADSILAAGRYTVKIRTDTHLMKLIPGIITITGNQPTVLPDIALVAGDINNDNRLDILDYNLLIGCYSDLTPAINCDAANKVLTDLNDDGNVNQFDYNLFLREISTQPGE